LVPDFIGPRKHGHNLLAMMFRKPGDKVAKRLQTAIHGMASPEAMKLQDGPGVGFHGPLDEAPQRGERFDLHRGARQPGSVERGYGGWRGAERQPTATAGDEHFAHD
jgi:hypothetical protein